jgi:hypothetical protein
VKDIRESTVFQTWFAIASLLLLVQCFGLLTSAVIHGGVAIWQGTPTTIDSAREIATSGIPILTELNANLIPALIFYILLPGMMIGFIADKVRAKKHINEKGVQA